jgi:hypothetical protein
MEAIVILSNILFTKLHYLEIYNVLNFYILSKAILFYLPS